MPCQIPRDLYRHSSVARLGRGSSLPERGRSSGRRSRTPRFASSPQILTLSFRVHEAVGSFLLNSLHGVNKPENKTQKINKQCTNETHVPVMLTGGPSPP